MVTAKRTKKVQSLVTRSLEVEKVSVIVNSKETCQIFQKWLAKFVKELQTDETYEQFLKECGKSFQPQPETFKTSPTTETTRSRNRQSIQSEPEKMN